MAHHRDDDLEGEIRTHLEFQADDRVIPLLCNAAVFSLRLEPEQRDRVVDSALES
jgi:hypothetical protein